MTFNFVGSLIERIGMARRWTSALLGRAILLAVAAAPLPAVAQPAATARPQGGQVVAGAAQINRTDAVTHIDQTSQRAAIDWRSFDVGSGQQVQFQQPSASAVTLNRVISADPSQIAGKITANGQVVVVNQSGVLFNKGAQINAQSVVVSAAGITNQNFMAGRMVFDQPARPDAQIVNEGRITVKQAGLAALVAPQVKNAGMISAKLGHVILGGAETHTLDLYGDGLLSFDVTGQVRQAPVDKYGKTQTTLVTNTGTIQADGGTVLLTASAVDGVVQNLVTAGGKIFASSVGDKTGTIVLGGTGGSLMVAGTLTADGRAPGTIGAVMLPPAVSVAFPVRSSTTLLALMLLARSRLPPWIVTVLFPVTDPPEIVTVPPSRTLFACNMPELVTARILAVLTVLLSIVMPFAVIEAPLLTNTVSSANNVIVFGMLITTVPFTATFAALIVMLLFAPLTLRLPDRIKPFGSVICPVALSVTVPEDVGRSRPGCL